MEDEAAHLWFHQEDGTLVLDARLVDRKDFAVEAVDGYTFIHPKRDKWNWSEDELRLRSVAIDQQGRVISSGWPKFFNMGERPANDAILETALGSAEDIHFTEKLDGTLIIRSVLPDGKIIFRTRGRWHSDDFAPLARAISTTRYPALLDPRILPEWSLLFEYVGPANLIVIAYGEEDLCFLGGVHHADLHLMSVAQLQEVARNNGLRSVPLVELPRSVQGMVEAVRGWEDREGVVARLHRGQLLIKLKSARYLALHAMRANMSYALIVEYARLSGINTIEELDRGLRELGYDYELTQIAKMHFSVYQQQQAYSEKALATARQLHAAFLALSDDPTSPPANERERRKRYAMQAARQLDPLRNVLFSLYDGREERALAALFRWYVVEQRA